MLRFEYASVNEAQKKDMMWKVKNESARKIIDEIVLCIHC